MKLKVVTLYIIIIGFLLTEYIGHTQLVTAQQYQFLT